MVMWRSEVRRMRKRVSDTEAAPGGAGGWRPKLHCPQCWNVVKVGDVTCILGHTLNWKENKS